MFPVGCDLLFVFVIITEICLPFQFLGIITLQTDFQICKEGDTLTPEQARLLVRINVIPYSIIEGVSVKIFRFLFPFISSLKLFVVYVLVNYLSPIWSKTTINILNTAIFVCFVR